MLLFETLGSPALEWSERNSLGLSTAIGSGSWLGEILLMIRLSIVPKTAILVVIRSGGNLGGNWTTELLLIGLLGGLDELLLFIIKVVEAASVLRSSIVALAHARRGIMRLPEPAKDIDKRNLLWIIHNAHSFSVAGAARARFFVRRILGEACTVAHSRGVDATGGREPPNSLLAAPEAAVGKDGHLVPFGNLGHVSTKHVVLRTFNVWHLLLPTRQCVLRLDQFIVTTAGEKIQDASDHVSADALLVAIVIVAVVSNGTTTRNENGGRVNGR